MRTAAKPFMVKRQARVKAGLRWRWAITGPLLGTLLLPALSACQQADPRPELPTVTEPPSGVVDSSRKYAPVLDEVRTALECEFPGIGWRAGDAPVSVLDKGSQGWWSVTSGNDQGARVRIFGRTWVELTLNVPVDSESCAAGQLTGFAP